MELYQETLAFLFICTNFLLIFFIHSVFELKKNLMSLPKMKGLRKVAIVPL